MNLFASEWIKTRSVRSTWVLAAATVVVTVSVSLLGVSALAGSGAASPAEFDPVGAGFKGILVGQILIAMLGAQSMTGEYATGQILSTLTVAPKRGALLGTKAAITGLVALVTAVVTVAATFAAAQAALAAAGLPSAHIGDPDTLRAAACATLYLVLTALIGLGFGTITRSGTGALSVVVAIALLVPALAPGVPGTVGEVLRTAWPLTAGQASYTITAGSSPLSGIAVMTVFTVWTMLAAHLTLRIRDA